MTKCCGTCKWWDNSHESVTCDRDWGFCRWALPEDVKLPDSWREGADAMIAQEGTTCPTYSAKEEAK